ncbi:MAG TPA: sigma-70 family RNA polymerase sigma factor [Terracidiphilus sp.]|nr:sigma-70 family RNA polymerase sigma factor [Terracidiphilus sp.]
MGASVIDMPGAQEPPAGFHVSALEEMTTMMAKRRPYFRRIAQRRLDNIADAEDAVQDAFLSAWRHLDQFQGQAQMSTWLTAIVMNSARMVLRRRPRQPHFPFDGQDQGEDSLRLSEMLPDGRPDPESEFRRRELLGRLNRLSTHLSPALREVIRLRSVEGLSTREVANNLGLTESAVKTRAARARAELRRLSRSVPIDGGNPAEYQFRRQRRRRKTGAEESVQFDDLFA